MCTTSRLTASENRRWPAVFSFRCIRIRKAPYLRGFFFAQASGDKHG
ncbi:hypothetical protein HMPREF1502_2622 [Klebsiella sp. AS10]|nr:hypothetical protein HMPREF1502_2622 [Klebsiella sp. AS10]